MAKTSGQLEKERIRQKSQIIISNPAVCYYCKSTGLSETDIFCANCAFPQGGTQSEMKKFIWNIHNKKKLLADQKKAVNKARNILYILAGVHLLAGILGLAIMASVPFFIVLAIQSGIYLGLGLWSRRQPFPAILTGFFIYMVFIVIDAVDNPSSLLSGIIWKIIFIAGFVYGYKGAKDSKMLEAELQSIKNAKDLNVDA